MKLLLLLSLLLLASPLVRPWFIHRIYRSFKYGETILPHTEPSDYYYTYRYRQKKESFIAYTITLLLFNLAYILLCLFVFNVRHNIIGILFPIIFILFSHFTYTTLLSYWTKKRNTIIISISLVACMILPLILGYNICNIRYVDTEYVKLSDDYYEDKHQSVSLSYSPYYIKSLFEATDVNLLENYKDYTFFKLTFDDSNKDKIIVSSGDELLKVYNYNYYSVCVTKEIRNLYPKQEISHVGLVFENGKLYNKYAVITRNWLQNEFLSVDYFYVEMSNNYITNSIA